MESSQKTKFWKRKRLTIGGVLVVVLLGSLVIWWIVSQQPKANESGPSTDKTQIDASVKQAEKDGKLREEATQKIKGDSTADANDLYQQAIDAEASAERKTRLYIDLSGVYYAAGKYKEAFEIMDKADEINPDKFLLADWLSRLYEDQKNYAKAAQYYRLAGEWTGSKQNITALDKAYFESKAAEMDSLARGKK